MTGKMTGKQNWTLDAENEKFEDMQNCKLWQETNAEKAVACNVNRTLVH